MPFGSGLPKFFPDLTYQCSPQCERIVSRFDKNSCVLDIGAGGRRLSAHVTTIDSANLPETDVVADICQLPFSDGSVDLVIATGLLEHVADDTKVLREARRVLKPGGVLHIEVPFLQQYHEDPIDYRRYTIPGLKYLLEDNGFQCLDNDFHIGPSVTMVTLSAYYAGILFEGRSKLSKVASNISFLLVACIGYPLKYLDSILKTRPSAHRLAFGVYCTAAKSALA